MPMYFSLNWLIDDRKKVNMNLVIRCVPWCLRRLTETLRAKSFAMAIKTQLIYI